MNPGESGFGGLWVGSGGLRMGLGGFVYFGRSFVFKQILGSFGIPHLFRRGWGVGATAVGNGM